MKVHDYVYEYSSMPNDTVMTLLNTELFMWVTLFFSIVFTVVVLSKLWKLHTIPKRLAKERGYSQVRLVVWLTLLGLFWKPLWIAAVLIVAIDWTAMTSWIKEIRQ